MEREGLVSFSREGRPQPWLAESWSWSADGLRLTVNLRPNVRFHDGKPMTAAAVSEFLTKRLPQYLGPPFTDVEQIRAVTEHQLEFVLKQHSNFLLESLDILVEEPASRAGTGPFYAANTTGDVSELRGNQNYYAGKPFIDRIVLKTYPSTRAAWADMLRGEVDMLYEVAIDALDSLKPSNSVKVFTQQRSYAYLVLLNVNKPALKDHVIRRRLNEAIDRNALVAEGLNGHGRPADGPVWPWSWAYDEKFPKFSYRPVPLEEPLVLTCLFAEPSLERLALTVQRQLADIGVDFKLELLPLDDLFARVQAGNFDAILADAIGGPTLVRPYWFWHTGGSFNWGHYRNADVDRALDTIRYAPDDEAYRSGVAAFQRTIIEDPPAIFLAWSERARAVSTRFDVPVDPGRDVLGYLRLWRPVAEPRATTDN